MGNWSRALGRWDHERTPVVETLAGPWGAWFCSDGPIKPSYQQAGSWTMRPCPLSNQSDGAERCNTKCPVLLTMPGGGTAVVGLIDRERGAPVPAATWTAHPGRREQE